MTLEARIRDPFFLCCVHTFCRFHQGYIPARMFSVHFANITFAQRVTQSFAVMQICWGAIDHGSGNLGSNSLVLSEILSLSLSQDMTFLIRRLIWMICCVGVLSG